jgi:uncharacterized repeat protein (TIGR01451 family)/MYXO-CTERM domain-containing protein
VVLSDTVPAHTVFVASGSTPGWSCPDAAPAGTVCTLAAGTVPAGAAGPALLVVRVADPLPAGVAEIVNTVSIADDGANGADPDLSNNTHTETTPVAGPGAAPDLAVVKDDGGTTAQPGDIVLYGLGFENLGRRGASGVLVTETVPQHTRFEAGASDPGWSCADGDPPGTSCTRAVGTLETGDSGTAFFAVRLDDPLATDVVEITNTASVSDDGTNGADPDLANNQASDTTPVVHPPDPGQPSVDAFKLDTLTGDVDADGEAGPGDVLTYTVTVENSGDGLAEAVELLSAAPAHTNLVVGAVTTTHGEVLEGNTAGDTGVRVVLGSLGRETAIVTFEVRIDTELPPDLEEIVCQGTVDGSNFPPLPTDDPDTPEPDDPTRTPLAASEPPMQPTDIPTASWPALGLLALALLAAARRRLRQLAGVREVAR